MGVGAMATADARREDGVRWLFRDTLEGLLWRREVARVVGDGVVAGAMCTGGVGVVVAGVVGGETTALGVVAGTATDSFALLGAFTIASNDGLWSRLFSDALSLACCFFLGNALGGATVAEVFFPAVAEGALATEDVSEAASEAASEAEDARFASSSSSDNSLEEAAESSVSA